MRCFWDRESRRTIDLAAVGVERAYYELVGFSPPEVFTATASGVLGRLSPVPIHVTLREGSGKARATVDAQLDAFLQIARDASGFSFIVAWLRKNRHGGEHHADWRLPLGLALDGRSSEARSAMDDLIRSCRRQPHGRRGREYRRLGLTISQRYLDT